jgi:hypothetical protein
MAKLLFAKSHPTLCVADRASPWWYVGAKWFWLAMESCPSALPLTFPVISLRVCVIGMHPKLAWILVLLVMVVICLSGIILANSRFGGSFFWGLLVLVAPLACAYFILFRVVPVRCPRCKGKMRYRTFRRWIGPESQKAEIRILHGFVCTRCSEEDLHEIPFS